MFKTTETPGTQGYTELPPCFFAYPVPSWLKNQLIYYHHIHPTTKKN